MDLKSSINIVCIFIIYLRYTANITRKNKNFATYNQLKVSGNTYVSDCVQTLHQTLKKRVRVLINKHAPKSFAILQYLYLSFCFVT